MVEELYLNPFDLKQQSNEAIHNLIQDNNRLLHIKSSLSRLILENSMKGDLINNIQYRIECYIKAINLMIQANNADIQDFIALQDLIGEEILDMQQIFPIYRNALKSMDSNETLSKIYATKNGKRYMIFGNFQKEYNQNMMNGYAAVSRFDSELTSIWKQKIERYYMIENATRNLFTEGINIRKQARRKLKFLSPIDQDESGEYIYVRDFGPLHKNK